MSDVVIRVENLYKEYRLGTISHGTLYRDLQSWWARIHGREDPNSIISVSPSSARNYSPVADSRNPHMLALNDVSFEVKQGDVLGIIGRNGAGKSTLLKILSEVTSPTKGRIQIRGRVASLLEVGTGFHPELTGRENIYLNGAILGMTKAEITKKFDEIVAFAEVEKFLDTPVKRYSSGMYVRLAFAVAAHLEPEIMVIDEVLAVGDEQFQKKCLGKMGDVAKEGRTVLFVSHNMTAVSALCNKGILLVQGSMAAQGPADEVIRLYLSQVQRAQTGSVTDLKDHPGRIRYREKALLYAWIENGEGARGGLIRMGEPMTIVLVFKSSRRIKAPGIGFGIENYEGRRIFSFSNYISPSKDIRDSVAEGVVRCTIPRLPLLNGSYSVTISLVERRTELVDMIEKAIDFDVEVADVYGSGIIPEKSQGMIFVDGNITCESVITGETAD